MRRPIIQFESNRLGDDIATLSCGHSQRSQRNSLFINLTKIALEEISNSPIGVNLNCFQCDKFELPDHFVPYKKTPIFTEESLPVALTRDHSTKIGIWAKIIISEGKLRYRVDILKADMELSQDKSGIIIPEIMHNVEPLGIVSFFIQFYKAPTV